MTATNDFLNMRLITGGDATLEIELLEAFLKTSHDYIEEMRKANEENNIEVWVRSAHSMKGGCFNLGANPLGQLCQSAQQQPDQPQEVRRLLLKSIEKELVDLEIIVQAMIKTRRAQLNG